VRVREDVRAVDDRLVHAIPLDSLSPSMRNPRQHLDGIDELAASLSAHGLLQPIVVRRCSAGYQLIAGHRRYEAARRLGWAEIPAVIRDESDDQAYILTLVENLQREDLTPKEEASALEVLVRERGWTTRQVGDAIKRGAMYVSRRLRVFDDATLAPIVLANKLPVSTAEEFLIVADAAQRSKLAQQAVDEHWTQPVARREVANCIVTIQPPSAKQRSRQLLKLVRQIRDVLGVGPVEDLTGAARNAAASLATELAALEQREGRRRRRLV
jgi:ParB family chromosome partitioning protein